MENGFFSQWCHSIPKNKNKESSVLKQNIFTSTGSTAYYTLDSSLTLTNFMRVLYPMKIRINDFQFAKKKKNLTQKRVFTQDLLAPAG
jgi:hypothetical protein